MKTSLPIREHKILLIGFAISVFLIYVGKIVINPIYNKIASTKSEIEKLNIEKSNILKEVELIRGKESEIKEKEKQLTEYFLLKSKLANLSNPSKFFKDITDFKKVRFISIKPAKREKVSHYLRMELTLSISGSYEDIYNYLKYLDSLPYIISIKKLDFSKGEQKSYNNVTLLLEIVGR
ncbi:MAG: type 4a pilus biogenesis protein PilO [Proteobacteria bacterium]|nr:type 4a pilus biogenesis protein PilO [Pseudomonadota bacterium]